MTREDVDGRHGRAPVLTSPCRADGGDQFASGLRTVTLEDITAFAEETGDRFYAHTDEEAAMATRSSRAGWPTATCWFVGRGAVRGPDPGPVLANYGLENLRFITPVTYDDAIRVTLTAKRITPRVSDEYGEGAWDCRIHNQKDELCAQYDVLTLVAKTWPMAPSRDLPGLSPLLRRAVPCARCAPGGPSSSPGTRSVPGAFTCTSHRTAREEGRHTCPSSPVSSRSPCWAPACWVRRSSCRRRTTARR
ncbi:hypothetical protein GS446_25390 [Rhodococcus hoagii]|nr:hypothetical protein [Prescottella equi]